MQRCFELALAGSGKVAPNPLVGAVLVHNNQIISEGFHEGFGGPHAEVNALKNINDSDLLSKSVLFVNLEPCSHYGKTPPCANLIIEKKVGKVVVSNLDPNPKVNGKGIGLLRSAGVEVVTGISEHKGWILNKRFFTFHTRHRPYVILKWAQSADGFIAPATTKNKPAGITWISNPTSRLLVHKWRSEEQSILVGSATAINDNPQLNVRGFSGNNPIRIVIDPAMELPGHLQVFDRKIPTLIFNDSKNEVSTNLEFIKFTKSKNKVRFIMDELYKKNILSVIIEGGAFTLNSFIKAGIWDEMRVICAPRKLNEGIAAPAINFEPDEIVAIDNDLLKIFTNKNHAEIL